jgi:hypothetical protein
VAATGGQHRRAVSAVVDDVPPVGAKSVLGETLFAGALVDDDVDDVRRRAAVRRRRGRSTEDSAAVRM